MAFVAPLFTAIGGAGAAAGAAGTFGTFGSILSTVGSIVGLASSFMGNNKPDYPSPPPVYIPPSEPLPSTQINPAQNLSADQLAQAELNEKRRRALLANKTNQDSTNITKGTASDPLAVKTTLLGS